MLSLKTHVKDCKFVGSFENTDGTIVFTQSLYIVLGIVRVYPDPDGKCKSTRLICLLINFRVF